MADTFNNLPSRPQALYQHLRQTSYDLYIALLFAPPALRDKLFTLFALSEEWAAIEHKVTDPLMQQIRFQWWREQLTMCQTTAARSQPVAHPALAMLPFLDMPPLYALLDSFEPQEDLSPHTSPAAHLSALLVTLTQADTALADKIAPLLSGHIEALSYKDFSGTLRFCRAILALRRSRFPLRVLVAWWGYGLRG